MTRQLDVTKCLSEGWHFFLANPWMAIAGILVYVFITFIGQFIPIFGMFFALLVSPVLLGGLCLFGLHLAGIEKPRIEDLFAGFSIYGRIMGVYWLYVAGSVLLLMPSIVAMTVSAFGNPYGDPSPAVLGVFFLNALVYFVIFLRYSMVFFIMVDEPQISVFDVFRRSSQLTVGNRGRVFLVFLLMGILSILGVFTLFIGYLVAAPVAMIAWARAYLWLKSFHPPFGYTHQPQPQPYQPVSQ